MPLTPGAVVVAYTDGLIERRGKSLDEGFALLCGAVRPEHPQQVCFRIMETLVGRNPPQDDIAVLALRRYDSGEHDRAHHLTRNGRLRASRNVRRVLARLRGRAMRWERLVSGLDRRSAARRLRRRDAALDERARPEPNRPAGTDLKPQIRHIVLLMMENHSFDNYLGRLGRGEGLPDRPPVNQAKDGRAVPAHPFSTTTQTVNVPSQSWRSSHVQFGGGHNDGFVSAIEDLTPGADRTLGMGYWQEKDLPFYYGLARTFPLADRWFSSCLGPTFPNRRFLLAATANGLIDDAIASIIDYPATGTIFDVLNRHGITWANYHHVPPGRLWRTQLGARGRRILTLAFGGFVPLDRLPHQR